LGPGGKRALLEILFFLRRNKKMMERKRISNMSNAIMIWVFLSCEFCGTSFNYIECVCGWVYFLFKNILK
jgi:hypothetical protein